MIIASVVVVRLLSMEIIKAKLLNWIENKDLVKVTLTVVYEIKTATKLSWFVDLLSTCSAYKWQWLFWVVTLYFLAINVFFCICISNYGNKLEQLSCLGRLPNMKHVSSRVLSLSLTLPHSLSFSLSPDNKPLLLFNGMSTAKNTRFLRKCLYFSHLKLDSFGIR